MLLYANALIEHIRRLPNAWVMDNRH